MANKSIITEVLEQSPNRRSLLKKIGMAGAAAGAAIATGGIKLSADPSSPTVVDVFNFALNLEYLEAEFYTYATTGMTLAQYGGVSGAQSTTTNGSQVNFGNNSVFTRTVALQIANDERNHVNLIRSALGSAAISEPPIDLGALGAYATELEFLTIARVFEDIGVSAYGGAAQLTAVTSSPYIGAAALILAAEAEHVANIRAQCAKLGVPSMMLDSVDLLPPPSGSQFFSIDAGTGLTHTRTPGQVLYLAYGNVANATAGGFFPSGVNGNIHTSSARA